MRRVSGKPSGKPSGKHGCIFYYQGFLAVGSVFLFFTFLDNFLVVEQIFQPPGGWLIPYFILVTPLFVLGKLRYPAPLVLAWCLFYILVATFSYFFISTAEGSFRVLIDQCFLSMFLFFTVYLYTKQAVQVWARLALVAAILLGVAANFYQFVHPTAFAGVVEGRASGFYMDPNDCSYALLLGMIFTIGLFKQQYRIPWLLVVGAGIVPTLSRGGLLSWFVVSLALIATRIISFRKALAWIVFLGMSLLALMVIGSGSNQIDLSFLDNHLIQRVQGIFEGESLYDPSALERKGILLKGWEMFLEKPLSGHGIGSTFDYGITGFTVSTHNMILLHLAEYGIIGVLILPLAIFSVIYYSSGDVRKIATVFSLFILLASLFSHTVLDQRSYLIGFSLMAAMSLKSRRRFGCDHRRIRFS